MFRTLSSFTRVERDTIAYIILSEIIRRVGPTHVLRTFETNGFYESNASSFL